MAKEQVHPGAISAEDLRDFATSFHSDPKNKLALNNVTAHGSKNCATVREAIVANNHQYSVKVPTEGKATSQLASGRCWLFAALNCVRLRVMKEHKIDAFELSQNFCFFWDKFEKAGYFLETILETLDEPIDGRLLSYLSKAPVNDGGQYDMFVNLVEKYGLCPKSAMPETKCSGGSRELNWLVTNRLRTFAFDLRTLHAAGKDQAALRGKKKEQLEEIYRILCIHLGQPPVKFDWKFRNKEKEFTCMRDLTPLSFAREILPKCDEGVNFGNQVSLVHDPRNEYYQLYTVDRLGNVVGGKPVLYINLPIEELKLHAKAELERGRPVWFGCDVGKFLHRSEGLMDVNAFDYQNLTGSRMTLNKADRLRYGESLMTHAMVFTGVDVSEEGKTQRWRVENSWGDKNGDKGYYAMTDAWFDEYMYQIVLDAKDLPAKVTDVMQLEPRVLAAWDPMGALANQ